ncbi:hypothetical protein [Pseudomonas fluorescens]|nr:hypothetical protein [Pseudomonas fluorescens]
MKASLPHKQKGAAIPFLNLPDIGRVRNPPANLTASASLQS